MYYAGDPYDVAPVARAVEAEGRRALVLECDVSSREAVDDAVARTVSELGGIDIVVANAGIARVVPSVDLDDERWSQLIDVDLTGVFRCFRAALPHMIAAGRGRLLATSSIVGPFMGWSEHVHYTAAKGGVAGLVRSLALEVARNGITVNAVAPGVIETPQSSDPVNSMGADGLSAFARASRRPQRPPGGRRRAVHVPGERRGVVPDRPGAADRRRRQPVARLLSRPKMPGSDPETAPFGVRPPQLSARKTRGSRDGTHSARVS